MEGNTLRCSCLQHGMSCIRYHAARPSDLSHTTSLFTLPSCGKLNDLSKLCLHLAMGRLTIPYGPFTIPDSQFPIPDSQIFYPRWCKLLSVLMTGTTWAQSLWAPLWSP